MAPVRARRATRDTCSCIFGAACPARSTAAGLSLPCVDAEARGLHLKEIAKTVATGAQALPVVDGTGWQKARALEVPENITLLKLPACAPELNPMENVRACLRANKLAITAFDSHEDIPDKCQDTWNFFENDPGRISSITGRDRAKVN